MEQPSQQPSQQASQREEWPDWRTLINEEDEIYEIEILNKPGELKPWLEYINYKKRRGSPLLEQCFVLERACVALPRSYKLWRMYLEFRVDHIKGSNPARFEKDFNKVNALFARALVLLNKMPVIWEMYLSFLCLQPLRTFTRHAFDNALRALPITQHDRIWDLYIPWVNKVGGPTAFVVWRRYMQLRPERVEEYIDLLVKQEKYLEAVQQYIGILNNPRFRSRQAKGPFQHWTEMLDLLTEHAQVIPNPVPLPDGSALEVDAIVKSGRQRFPDQCGALWVGLARYHINVDSYERARDIFEEGITSVGTVRDFTLIFDSYAQAEQTALEVKMEELEGKEAKGTKDDSADVDIDLRMMRFESLMDRRPFLLNNVLLRQNPHNIFEWKRRVGLWGDNKDMVAETYADAIAAINPKRAAGRFCELWASYAKFYETGGDLPNARVIMEKAVKVPFKSVSELADTWIEWAEMELRSDEVDNAVRVMETAVKAPRRSNVDYFDDSLTPQQRAHKSLKLWSFYVDLVEATAPLAETRKVYERILELRIATPQIVANYAILLEDNGYFEDSFKVYERGLDLFSYPLAFELWNLYLQKAVDRQIGLERLRDLFEQALEGCPPKFSKKIYLMYGALEEDRGLARGAMRIYERATRAVADEDKSEMFEVYITKSASNFGVTSTRPIYENAIETLPDKDAALMCVKFAELERRLGEIDRARAIYEHASSFCDPRVPGDTGEGFWKKWEQFEVQHGNEDTFKEMLRIKRSVQAAFNTDVNFVASQAIARQQAQEAANVNDDEPYGTTDNADAMANLELQARAPVGFVAATTGPEGGDKPQKTNFEDQENEVVKNDAEIDLDDDM